MSESYFVGDREYFTGIGKIPFEGRESDNPLAFKFYDGNKRIGDKTMAEHLRFAVCYWHTFCAKGSDPFGPDTQVFAWDSPSDPMDASVKDAIVASNKTNKHAKDSVTAPNSSVQHTQA